jgi:hypothetical protein
MITLKKQVLGLVLAGAVLLVLAPAAVWADPYIDDFHDYDTADGKVYHTLTLPQVAGGWFTTVDFFPPGATGSIGPYEVAGRGIALNNQSVYLQQNYGSDLWIEVGRTATVMDPAFIHVSEPDSTGDVKIAIGKGYGQNILIFSVSDNVLTVGGSPPNLDSHASVDSYNINHYDSEWLQMDDGSQILLINGGSWPGPPYGSSVVWLDTDSGTPETPVGGYLITDIPGASSGVAVDNNGNVIAGIGYSRTGEIKLWTVADVEDVINGVKTPRDYETTGKWLAAAVLSAATMGVDAENNLHVGGGRYVEGDPTELGRMALIHHDVVARVAAGDGSPGNAVHEYDPDEYKAIAPDPCMDDSATFVTYNRWAGGLAVVWNPDEGDGCKDPGDDEWQVGVVPVMSMYYPRTASDNVFDVDNDGIPDASDNAYLTANPGQEDADGDGWANIADADFNNDKNVNLFDLGIFRQAYCTENAVVDMNSSGGAVNIFDLGLFRGRYGESVPFY